MEEHIAELRSRMLKVFAFFILFFITGLFFSQRILRFLISHTKNISIVSIGPLDYFSATINVAIFFAIIITLPFALLEAYLFLRPAMLEHERRMAGYSILSSIFLFYAGMVFGYFGIVKLGISFLSLLATNAGIENMWSINLFLGFVLWASIGIGIAFQMPVVSVLLAKFGIVEQEMLKGKRAYVIVAIFIFAAIITPPDVFTQILIALPMIALYELSILCIKLFK